MGVAYPWSLLQSHYSIGWTGIHDVLYLTGIHDVLYLLLGSDVPFIAGLIEDDDTPGSQTLTNDVCVCVKECVEWLHHT